MKTLNDFGIKERRVGTVTILETDALMRINRRFGRSSTTLARAVEVLMAGGQMHILLNLDGVNTISAKTLGDLVATHQAVKQGGGEFKLFNLTRTARQLMRATNLEDVFSLYRTEKEAIESFADGRSATTAEMFIGAAKADR